MSPLLRTFWLGAGLIVLTNAVVLGGVAYNRSGEPQSRLQLSERELSMERSWLLESSEHSGLVLNLDYRMTDGWVTADKLQRLGFKLERGGERVPGDERSERDGLVVLELAGPAFQAERQAAATALTQARQAHAADPQDAKGQRDYEAAQKELGRLDHTASRLYVVDVGTDADELRARYPDQHTYALARSKLRYYTRYGAQLADQDAFQLVVDLPELNVPNRLRNAFVGWNWHINGGIGNNSRVRVDLAFGQRFEPWIVAAESLK